MKSHTTEGFRKALANLPESVQRQAKEAYNHFAKNPYHTIRACISSGSIPPKRSILCASTLIIVLLEYLKMMQLFGFGLDHMLTMIS